MKPKYLISAFLILFVYSIIVLSIRFPIGILRFGWEALGISVIFLFGYFLLRLKQNNNKDFRKRSLGIGITCSIILFIFLSSVITKSNGIWVTFVVTLWIFMIGSIIGLFISEIIQWGIVTFKKD